MIPATRLTINSGAVAAESAVIADMLWRMYTCWAEQLGFGDRGFDIAREEVTTSSATVRSRAPMHFGYSKAERRVSSRSYWLHFDP